MALIDKASLLMVPSTYEAGKLYNVLPSGNRAPDSTDQNSGYDQTRADFDFDRGSNAAATRVNASGLIEKYRENKLLQSNQFNTTWTKYRTSVTSGQSGYDGNNNAWLLTCTNNDGNAYQLKSASGVLTFSYYAKAGSVNWTRLRIDSTTLPDINVWVNLTDGSIGTDNGIATYVESVGNGWYRISTQTNTTGIDRVHIYPSDSDTNNSSTGSIYIQSAQLESGLVASSYLESTSVTGKAGVLVDLPRINYDANGENGALLLEPSRANLIPQSEYFGAWTLNGGGTGSNPILDFGYTSPEGIDNAYKVTFDTGAGTTTSDESIMYISKSGLTAGNDYTASVYLKGAVGGEEVIVRDTEGSYTKWTLTTEWKRYEMTQAAAGSSYATSFGVRQGLGGIGTINSNAIVYMYAFQSEPGSYVSSYIPTMGTSETRAADSCSVTGVSDVIGQTEGTFFVEFEGLGSDTAPYLALSAGGSTANRVLIYESSGINAQIKVGGAVVFQSTTASVTGNIKAAVAYKANDFVLYVNGSQYGTSSSGSAFGAGVLTEVEFDHASAALIGAQIKKTIVFNERLTNEELATLTTL